jgi:hypothetical protein
MDKFSIINSAKMISEARGDEADAILICRINDGESQISIIGLSKDKTDAKAILMAESLVTLIKGDLSMAYKLNTLFYKYGITQSSSQHHYTIELTREEAPLYNAGKARDEAEPEEDDSTEEDSVEDPEAKNTGKVFARELVDALLYSVFGGDSNNEDDA